MRKRSQRRCKSGLVSAPSQNKRNSSHSATSQLFNSPGVHRADCNLVRCAYIDPSKIPGDGEWQQCGCYGAAFDKVTEVRNGPKIPKRVLPSCLSLDARRCGPCFFKPPFLPCSQPTGRRHPSLRGDMRELKGCIGGDERWCLSDRGLTRSVGLDEAI